MAGLCQTERALPDFVIRKLAKMVFNSGAKACGGEGDVWPLPLFQVNPQHGLEKKRSGTKDFKVFPMTEDHIGEALLRVRA